MSVCESYLCNQLGAYSDWLNSSLSVYENYYLSASFAQPIKRQYCELVSSLSAYESSLVYLEKISIPT